MPVKIITFAFSFFIISISASAQNIEEWIGQNEKVPVEKIYLHTDAEFYFLSDTLWYKLYLMDSKSGQLIPRAENVYIYLFDDRGQLVYQSMVLSVKGQAAGSIALPSTLRPGNYMLQGFTDYLMNFSPDTYFKKTIPVSRISSSVRSDSGSNNSSNMVADVSFLPQGGVLLENITNLVAFKAVSKSGKGVPAKGTVRDDRGNTVATFKTDYKGMGLFFLTPEAGKKYVATISGFPSFSYQFEPLEKGAKIQVVNHTSKEVIINISSNTEAIINNAFYLVGMHRGEVIFYQPFEMQGLNQVIRFNSELLKSGINKLVLLDSNLIPVSERMLFSQNYALNELEINTQLKNHNKRSEVNVIIENALAFATDISNLSMSVLFKDALANHEPSQNILSSLLIDSELNGYIESSADYFQSKDFSSEAKLRLLMLTNGWSSYNWNSIPSKNEALEYTQKAGIDLAGKATNLVNEKALENGEITMVIQKKDEAAFLTQLTDENGNFVFPGLLFNDTAKIHIQAKNLKGKQSTEIVLYSPFKDGSFSLSHIAGLSNRQVPPVALQKQKYKWYSENRKYEARYKSNDTENSKGEIDLSADNHFRLYETADFVLEVGENEQSYEDILDYMTGKVPGVDISGDQVTIRGMSGFGSGTTPLFLVDGVPLVSNTNFEVPNLTDYPETEDTERNNLNERVIRAVQAIPISDVDKIEVLKSPQNLSAFGVRGANGVIAIYTRSGETEDPGRIAKGLLSERITGYASIKEFYSPKYDPETKNEKPDFRTTLFWEPFITTDNGKAALQFFSSDQSGAYIILVEGITNNGNICIGKTEFNVNK